MLRAEGVFAWVALSRAPALDAQILSKVLGILGDAPDVINASDAALQSAGVPPLSREYLSSAEGVVCAAERAWLLHPDHHVVPFTDPRYPALLRELSSCPIALYVAGNVGVLSDPQLAIVGSRNPSPAGRDIAFEFAESLAGCGLAITSGLADGIDSAAHRGALKAQGVTLAVLGSGIDVIYPRINRALSDEICRQGALISEFPLGTPPRRENFPQPQSHHRYFELRHAGGRSRAAQRLLDHGPTGGRSRPGAVRGSGLDPQSPEPRLSRTHPPGREINRNRR